MHNFPFNSNIGIHHICFTLLLEKGAGGSIFIFIVLIIQVVKVSFWCTLIPWGKKFSAIRSYSLILSGTFSQGFWISKFFGHQTLGSGGKIGLKICHMKRDIRQTDRHTDIATTISNRPSGPIRWKNSFNLIKVLVLLPTHPPEWLSDTQ